MNNYTNIEKYLINFLKTNVKNAGFNNVVLGLSGGVDSAVVAILLKKAFGKNFLAIMMPSYSSNPQNIKDAKKLCKRFDINYTIEPIGNLVDVYFKDKEKDAIRIGNFSARIRMATLYDFSSLKQALVIGTSNKSEIALGYGTLYGDLACAINPIGDMYKSDIFEFAKYLGVTQSIIEKPPSADLWEGQSDEQELGFTYKAIDEILKQYLDKDIKKEILIQRGYDEKLVTMIHYRFHHNKFKGQLPIIADLSKYQISIHNQ